MIEDLLTRGVDGIAVSPSGSGGKHDVDPYALVDDAFLPYMHERMVPPMSEARMVPNQRIRMELWVA